MVKHRARGKTEHDQLQRFVRDLRLTYNQLRDLADRLHADLEITASLRAVMEFVALQGPSTVPAIAEQRSVSRQGIQKLVNTLLKREVLVRKPNPGHRRSDLIALTPRGRALFRTMLRREAKYIGELAARLPAADIERSRSLLGAIRSALLDLQPGEGE